MYHPPSINCFHLPSGTVRSVLHLSGGSSVWRQTLPQEERACPSACSGRHISQVTQQSTGLSSWLVWQPCQIGCPSRSLEHCVLTLRLLSMLHTVEHETMAPCNEYCYPCLETSSKPKVSLVLFANTFPGPVMAQLLPLLRRSRVLC